MGILDSLKQFIHKKKSSDPEITFGRFSDAYKSERQIRAFDESLELFEKGEYLAAYRAFFVYLKDENSDNLSVVERDGALHFEFWQGSQLIKGFADEKKIKAFSQIAKADDLKVSFMRRLMEANFSLKFCRFALDEENTICVLFDSFTIDGAPHKLLFALRELAIHADKQDDLMLDEFKVLKPAHNRDFGEIPEAEKEIKYNYLKKEIENALALYDKGEPDTNKNPGHYAFLFLALAFKLDYLIKPEGVMMDSMERIYGIYFAQNNQTSQAKVQVIRRELEKLLSRDKSDFFREMYRTRSTFGINPSVNHEAIANLIDGKLPNIEKPIQDGHNELAMSVAQYIAGFALFHHAPPKPDRELLHLFFQVTESAYFRELGFDIPYVKSDGRLDQAAIHKAVKDIDLRNRNKFKALHPDWSLLNFASETLFAKSFLWMIRKLDVIKVE